MILGIFSSFESGLARIVYFYAQKSVFINRKPIFQSTNYQNLGQFEDFAHSENIIFR